MSEPLFDAFLSRYAFSQNLCCEVAADFPSILEAVCNSFRRTVGTNRHSIDLRIDSPEKRTKCKFRPRTTGFLALKSIAIQIEEDSKWTGAMVLGRGLKANDTGRYALTGENDLALKVCGIVRSGIKPAADFQKESTLEGSG